jgi:hypothetical protein
MNELAKATDLINQLIYNRSKELNLHSAWDEINDAYIPVLQKIKHIVFLYYQENNDCSSNKET